MCFDGLVCAVIHRARFHLGLHDAERLFDFPAGAADFQQVRYGMLSVAQLVGIFLKVGAYGIEAVVLLLLIDAVVIYMISGFDFGQLSIGGAFILLNVAPEVLWRIRGISMEDGFFGFVEILTSLQPLIFKIFKGERHDATLFELCLHAGLDVLYPCRIPALFIEGLVFEGLIVLGLYYFCQGVFCGGIARQMPSIIGQCP